MLRCLVFVLFFAVISLEPAVGQQAPDPWVGKQVVTKQQTPLMVGRQVVDDGRKHRVYRVVKIDSGQLWLVSGSLAGWIPASEVVTTDQALDHFGAEIRANPKSNHAYMRRAAIWHDRREFDRAIADLTEAIRLDPGDALAFQNRAWNWSAKLDYDRAIADYDRAIALDPKHTQTLINRGGLLHAKKEYAKSIADLSEVVRLDPKSTDGHNGRAWIWSTCPDQKHRDGKKAVASATRACELTDWKYADGLGTLAAAHAETGNFGKAVEWQAKANPLYDDVESKRKGTERLALYQANRPYRAPK